MVLSGHVVEGFAGADSHNRIEGGGSEEGEGGGGPPLAEAGEVPDQHGLVAVAPRRQQLPLCAHPDRPSGHHVNKLTHVP